MSGAVVEATQRSSGIRSVFSVVGAAAIGGKSGAERAAKKLPVQEYQMSYTVDKDIEQAYNSVFSIIVDSSEFIELIEIEDEPQVPVITTLVGSGKANLNPTVLCAVFIPDGKSTNIELVAYAKEGLIKQHSAERLSGELWRN